MSTAKEGLYSRYDKQQTDTDSSNFRYRLESVCFLYNEIHPRNELFSSFVRMKITKKFATFLYCIKGKMEKSNVITFLYIFFMMNTIFFYLKNGISYESRSRIQKIFLK